MSIYSLAQPVFRSRLFQRVAIAEAVVAFVFALLTLTLSPVKAGQLSDMFFQSADAPAQDIDHSGWEELLQKYVVHGDDELNRVRYKEFKKNGRERLTRYLTMLQSVDVTKLNRDQQFAYWANLYNAKTVDLILDHYPVRSIKDIDISPGLFADGPWGKKVVKVNGVDLSLDDIEHKILRVLWKDPRVHYAVNCASVGCPNLLRQAFRGKNLDEILNIAARGYVNSPRGAAVNDGELVISKIYNWFSKDFGESEKEVIAHLVRYAGPDLANQLKKITVINDYEYDWSLNDTVR